MSEINHITQIIIHASQLKQENERLKAENTKLMMEVESTRPFICTKQLCKMRDNEPKCPLCGKNFRITEL